MVTLTVTWMWTEAMPLHLKMILGGAHLKIPALPVQWQTGVQLPKQLPMPYLACDGDSNLKQQPAELTVIKKAEVYNKDICLFWRYTC